MKIQDLKNELVIGVIGGMGPQATVDFLGKLVSETKVSREQEHLHVLVDSNPKIPDRNLAINFGGAMPGPALAEMARRLEQAGADFLVMTCNTAHVFELWIKNSVSIPFVNMIEEARDVCVRDYPKTHRVGILAAPGCIKAGLYKKAFQQRNVETMELSAQDMQRFSHALYRIKVEGTSIEVCIEMQILADKLISMGAEVIVAGCTEVPLVLKPCDINVPLIDVTLNLAQRCVIYARRQESIALTLNT